MEEDDNYCIIKNDNKYNIDNYFFIGKLFAYAIKVRANIEIRLNPLLLYLLKNSDFLKTSFNEENENKTLLNNIREQLDSLDKTPTTIRNILLLETYEEELFEEFFEDFKNKYKIIIDNLFKLVIKDKNPNDKNPNDKKKNLEETMKFIEGFNSIIDPSLLEDISINDLNLLIAGNNNIDVNLFLDNLEFVNVNKEQLDLIKNIIIEYANEDNTYLNEFLFWIANKKTLSHNGYKDFQKKLQVKFVPEQYIKKKFTFTNKQGITVESEHIEIGSHTCTNFVYTEVPNTWLINDDDGTIESKLRTGFSKVRIKSYSEGKFTNAGGACSI
jgi:hypothetical protein